MRNHPRLINGGLLLLAALLPNLAFPRTNWYLLGWVAFVPYFFLLDRFRNSLRNQLLISLATATLAYGYGYSWIAGTLHEFAQLPLPVCYLLLLAFCALGSLSLLPFVLLRHFWLRSACAWGGVVVLGLLWVAMELWIPRLFPWYAGLTQQAAPIPRQIAELGGITAVSLVVIWTNLVTYTVLQALFINAQGQSRVWIECGVVAVIIIGLLAWGGHRQATIAARLINPARTLRVALIQGNVENKIKRHRLQNAQPAQIESADRRYLRLTLEAATHQPDLIIWPETAFSYFVRLNPGGATADPVWNANRQFLQNIARRSQATLLVGGLEAEGQPRGRAAGFSGDRNYNAALLVSPDETLQSYRKQVLIPFGERLPWLLDVLWPGLKQHMPRRFEFSAGGPSPPLDVQGVKLAVTICYEAILENYVRAQVRSANPEILINLTNDSWFGRSAEPHQHLALAAFQAIAHRRPLLRATNSGISAYVDALGKIHHPTDLFQTAVRVYDIPLVERPRPTFYTRWGSSPMGMAALGALLMTALNSWHVYRTRKA